MRILIIEDDGKLANTLREALRTKRYDCDTCSDGEIGLDLAMTRAYDLIIADVVLPSLNGIALCGQLRKAKIATPLLILTAHNDADERALGLNSGADYFLTKPIYNPELFAGVKALTRRRGEVIMDTLSFGDLTLHLTSCELSFGKNRVRLSKKEFSIMQILLGSGGVVVSKDTLLNKVWGYDSTAGENSVEVYISLLRKKLAILDSGVKILTLRKFGYRMFE